MGGGHGKGQGFDSSGHETRVRGNAYQVLEKYLQLARDAGAAGDRVAAENFLQHADHYYRVLSSMNEGQRPRIGGRELSVADVNVQNVSQGLSAAMYGSGNSQGLPGMTDGGNQGGDEGAEPGQEQQGQRHEQRHQGQQDRQHQRHNQGQGRGQGGGQHAQNPSHAHGQAPAQPAPGNVAGGNGHSSDYAGYAPMGEQPPVAYGTAAAQPAPGPVDEQPDYPEELLPAATPPAESQGEATPDAQARAPRGPRGRLRGPRRGPRPVEGTQGGPDSAE